MSSRNKILNAIAAHQPDQVAMPVIHHEQVITFENPFLQFKTIVESIGGKVVLVPTIQFIQSEIQNNKSASKYIINTVSELGDVPDNLNKLTAAALEKLDTVYIRATLGVAENGAVWVSESQMKNRLLPFICEHLVLIINQKDIVATMHQAYNKIDISTEGFGAFIAGPSKTADIEQSLVIGAHGAKNATIYIIE
ncbi:lactate utilization protein B/C [Flavobacterium sp. GA093]|uniref:Lactate utilization protein B/C n=1 Tax=Flavobacterium hydrocarbonoxydans TaxID=2683249 RepID=A0A6I4NS01_9FLAO|nr:LUD domain-containing protein [Flavobacterium hydrocarbonoxydans]MWB93894.1 lactate utilization protein B/C [Flavobacterium hydrocarbonoxydans]